MAQSPSSVLADLIVIFPDFAKAWSGSDNYYSRLDDGFFTYHGVFTELTHFYRDQFKHASPAQVARLSEKLNTWFGGANNDLDNAVATCFLENIAGEQCARALKPLLKEKAVEYMRQWESAT